MNGAVKSWTECVACNTPTIAEAQILYGSASLFWVTYAEIPH